MSGRAVRNATEARLTTSGGFGEHGSATEHPRYAELLPSRVRNRRRCHCGCGGRSSHAGMANGVALTSGCELTVRRWVRDPDHDLVRNAERYRAELLARPNGAVRCAGEGCDVDPVLRPPGQTLASTRKALRDEHGWVCDARGDYCPDHHRTADHHDQTPGLSTASQATEQGR